VIGLDDLADGAELGSLSDSDLAAVLCRLAAVQARVAVYLSDRRSAQAEDRLLTASEAAIRLGVTRTWLYRRSRSKEFSFIIVRLDGRLRYSTSAIERLIAARRAG
jgi:predicted DNA-binding transcriptional regulator AlpA